MKTTVVQVLNNGTPLPEYESEFAVGVDLSIKSFIQIYKGDNKVDMSKLKTSINRGYIYLRGFERILLGTGIFVAIPILKQLEIRGRSGVCLKRGLFVGNSPATIDPDYRGEIGVIIYNSTPYLNKLSLEEKIAQAVLMPYDRISWKLVDKLSETVRNTGGFGSTGI